MCFRYNIYCESIKLPLIPFLCTFNTKNMFKWMIKKLDCFFLFQSEKSFHSHSYETIFQWRRREPACILWWIFRDIVYNVIRNILYTVIRDIVYNFFDSYFLFFWFFWTAAARLTGTIRHIVYNRIRDIVYSPNRENTDWFATLVSHKKSEALWQITQSVWHI